MPDATGHPDDARGNNCAGDDLKSALFAIAASAQTIPTSDSNDTMRSTIAMMITGGRYLVRERIR